MASKKGGKYSAKYTKFVLDIATDADKMEKFRANPLKVAKTAGLTQEEMLVMLSGKSNAILAGVDPASFKRMKAFHVHIHVDIESPIHPSTPPCCHPEWTALPSEKPMASEKAMASENAKTSKKPKKGK
jgi:hypothetical protein